MVTYKKFTHLEHILARPDTYVGALKPDTSMQWVFDDDENKIVQKILNIFQDYIKYMMKYW